MFEISDFVLEILLFDDMFDKLTGVVPFLLAWTVASGDVSRNFIVSFKLGMLQLWEGVLSPVLGGSGVDQASLLGMVVTTVSNVGGTEVPRSTDSIVVTVVCVSSETVDAFDNRWLKWIRFPRGFVGLI